MKNNAFLLLCLGSLFFSSCRTAFRITIQIPAAVDLPNNVSKIIVLNNAQLQKQNIESKIDGVLTGEQINGDELAIEAYSIGLTEALSKGKYKSETIGPKIIQKPDCTTDWRVLDTIFNQNNAQAVITINSFDSDSPIGGVVLGNVLGQKQNTLYAKSYISAYCDNREVIQNIMVRGKYIIPTSGSLNPLAMLNDVMNKRKFYSFLGANTGFTAGSYFFSNWIWVDRIFYNKGSKGLRQTKKMIRFGNWDIAEKKLKFILEHSQKNKELARASFNLALVYEGQGRIVDAIQMAETSAINYNCKKAPEYLQILNDRNRMEQIIQWQREN